MKGHSNFRAVQLQNNFGLTDQAVIGEAEALFTTMAALAGMPKGDFGVDHYKSIHKHILGDMYPWAGEFRTAKLRVGDNYAESSAPPALLELEVGRVLNSLQAEKAESMNAVEFADKLSLYYGKLYAISPFPDGNARTARFIIDAFAEKHQMQVSWENVPAEAFHAAVQQHLAGNSSGLKQVFRAITDHQDLYALHSVDAIQSKVTAIATAAGLRDGYMPTQTIASNQDLGKLANYVKMRLSEDLKSYAQGRSSLRDWDKTSIQHEMNGKVDRQSTGPDALNRALEHMNTSANGRQRPPGL